MWTFSMFYLLLKIDRLIRYHHSNVFIKLRHISERNKSITVSVTSRIYLFITVASHTWLYKFLNHHCAAFMTLASHVT